MKNKRLGFSVVVMAMIFLLVACSSADTKGGKSSVDKVNNKDKQTVVYGRGADSVSLDPSTVTDGESFKVARNIFETLLVFGEQDTSTQPGLAKDTKISDDGKTYTFTLEENVKFHDGTDFNAEAVVKNFERWMNGSADQFPYYADMFGGFKGDKNHIIDSVKANGDYTFIIQLKKPMIPLLNNLAMVAFSIASPTAFEKDGEKFGENPVGTGPFKFSEWKRNDSVILTKNDSYWQDGLPKMDKVIFKAMPDNAARLNALLSGEIDIADGVAPASISTVEQNDQIILMERPSFNVGYLGMTTNKAPFTDIKLRQAISHAVDRQVIADTFFEGKALVAKNPVQPTALGYSEDTPLYDYNPEKAKALLKESTYDGKELELWAMPVPRPYMPDGQKVAEAIQKNLADVGIKTKIVSFEWATYLEKTKEGEADLFLLGGTSDNGDPDNLLSLFFDRDGSLNNSQFSNDEVQKLLQAGRSEQDVEKRKEIYKQIQLILHKEAPVLPLIHSTPLLAVSKSVKDFKAHPTEADDLKNVSVE
ncbi:ABC transporter substrate-binding protein [Viridibacillus sp. NPDC093762]|uniref:ABC transporter substrate-binding protein n=1 Tax=Viridibacillus sp. NPDC093762 TaxID=3390720 RepID=UPI003CFE8C4A